VRIKAAPKATFDNRVDHGSALSGFAVSARTRRRGQVSWMDRLFAANGLLHSLQDEKNRAGEILTLDLLNPI
jgi:hypothetical protein